MTWISHGFACVLHPDPPPTSLPIPSLWVSPVHQPWALVSCIQPGLAICFVFVSGFRKGSNFNLLHVDIQFPQNRWLKWLPFSHSGMLAQFLKISWTDFQIWRFTSELSILSHWSICLSWCQYHTILITVILWLVSFEVRKCESFSFQDCFSYSESLEIPYEFQGEFFSFCKIYPWEFLGISLNL